MQTQSGRELFRITRAMIRGTKWEAITFPPQMSFEEARAKKKHDRELEEGLRKLGWTGES